MGLVYSALQAAVPGTGDYNTPNPLDPTWTYRHIALCLNERKTKLGFASSLSALETELNDAQIDYTHINAARVMIETMTTKVSGAVKWFCRDKSYLVDGNGSPLSVDFELSGSDLDLEKFLVYCGLSQSSWMNVASTGRVSYTSRMASGDTLVLKMIRELKTAVKKLVYRRVSSTPGNQSGKYYSSGTQSNTSLAWSNRANSYSSVSSSVQCWLWMSGTTGNFTLYSRFVDFPSALTYASTGTASKKIQPLGYSSKTYPYSFQLYALGADFLGQFNENEWKFFTESDAISDDSASVPMDFSFTSIGSWSPSPSFPEDASSFAGLMLGSIYGMATYTFDNDATIDNTTY